MACVISNIVTPAEAVVRAVVCRQAAGTVDVVGSAGDMVLGFSTIRPVALRACCKPWSNGDEERKDPQEEKGVEGDLHIVM